MAEKATNFAFVLNQNYPNPFNSTTKITFRLSKPDKVSLMIFNLSGEVVASLIKNQTYSIGLHSIEFDANGLSNGIYFCRFITSQGGKTNRI
ncbi:MAG TPA: T9SS type A sorting domain-containing protein, partial [bacterium]